MTTPELARWAAVDVSQTVIPDTQANPASNTSPSGSPESRRRSARLRGSTSGRPSSTASRVPNSVGATYTSPRTSQSQRLGSQVLNQGNIGMSGLSGLRRNGAADSTQPMVGNSLITNIPAPRRQPGVPAASLTPNAPEPSPAVAVGSYRAPEYRESPSSSQNQSNFTFSAVEAPFSLASRGAASLRAYQMQPETQRPAISGASSTSINFPQSNFLAQLDEMTQLSSRPDNTRPYPFAIRAGSPRALDFYEQALQNGSASPEVRYRMPHPGGQ